MVKHILTTNCPRSCSYCIMRNVKVQQADKDQLHTLPALYSRLSKEHDSIMLTGGEPTSAAFAHLYFVMATKTFKKTFITTQNDFLLEWDKTKLYFDAVTFSWHDLKIWRYPVTNGATVYCSIMSHLYSDWLVDTLIKFGYAGLTINENYFGTDVFDETRLPQIDGFSIKINRRGKCINDGTVFILPDLTVTKDIVGRISCLASQSKRANSTKGESR